MCAGAQEAWAQTYVVTSLADPPTSGSWLNPADLTSGTLRWAITSANAVSILDPAPEVVLDSTLVGSIMLDTCGGLEITRPMTVSGYPTVEIRGDYLSNDNLLRIDADVAEQTVLKTLQLIGAPRAGTRGILIQRGDVHLFHVRIAFHDSPSSLPMVRGCSWRRQTRPTSRSATRSSRRT